MKTPEAMRKDPDFPIFQAGVEEGRQQMQVKALSFLEKEYLDDAIERKSVKGEYILQLAKELSEHLKAASNGQNNPT